MILITVMLRGIVGFMGFEKRPFLDEWLDYMKYLKANYPDLFSLAIRTNPFDPQRLWRWVETFPRLFPARKWSQPSSSGTIQKQFDSL
jgi:hypothetical protein